jgi:hypothetical protein
MLAGEHRPADPGQLVGERHDDDVLVLTGQQASQPAPDRRVALGEPLEDRPGAVDEILAQLAVAALAAYAVPTGS